jgi:hypothetical protein
MIMNLTAAGRVVLLTALILARTYLEVGRAAAFSRQ